MNNRRNVTFAVVAVLALGLGLVVYGILTAQKKPEVQNRSVVISAVRIPLHAHITPAMLTVEQRPADKVDPAALVNASDAIGDIAMAEIPAASPILPAQLTKPAATPAPNPLEVPVGMRAVTISIDQVKGLAGLLQPGDHVDVIAAPPRGPGEPEAYTIVRDARVLAVGSSVVSAGSSNAAPPGGGNAPPPPQAGPAPTTATLMVTPAQADLVASADINANLRLALRSPHEPLASQPVQALVYPTPPPAASPTPAAGGIQVINGDQLATSAPAATTQPDYILVPKPPRV